jgi:hypothetical protein
MAKLLWGQRKMALRILERKNGWWRWRGFPLRNGHEKNSLRNHSIIRQYFSRAYNRLHVEAHATAEG